jgi:uncharacterized membrane protein HdeD (DUF308 family)
VPDNLSQAEIHRARRWLTVTGVLSLLTGALSIAVPPLASVSTAIFIGWVLVFAGVVLAVEALRHPDDRPMWQRYVVAAMTLVVGLYLVIFPLTGTITLTVALAAWFFTIGGLELVAAWRRHGAAGNGMVALHGAMSVALGLLIAVSLPSSAGWAIGLLVGVSLLFFGVRTLMAASALKRAEGVAP